DTPHSSVSSTNLTPLIISIIGVRINPRKTTTSRYGSWKRNVSLLQNVSAETTRKQILLFWAQELGQVLAVALGSRLGWWAALGLLVGLEINYNLFSGLGVDVEWVLGSVMGMGWVTGQAGSQFSRMF
ncbi:Transmembrane emp24 domain-containing protein 5, partial [Bienertia sinuspersici]